ncbi:MAG TPA: glycosyltransferase [Pyrinomonadaceae bacterium]|jgi:GT2 family glycosyltransferase|nr:glycosyltransferase [Pyrinomonadaceae bacterium]
MLRADDSAREDERGDDAPAVSIIIPAYNAAQYIGEALDSVFAQTFNDYEVIVVNDDSPDTSELERALAPYSGRIVYVKQENRGPGGARNTAILKARGEWMALLDSDDVWLPTFLSEQLEVLRENPALDLIYADALLFGDGPSAGRTFMQLNPSHGPVTFESLLNGRCTVITSCVVARKQALVAAGLFDENFYHSEDFDLWLRLARRGGQFTYQPRVLARHRMHAASLSADDRRLIEGELRVYQKLLGALPASASEHEPVRARMERRRADLALEDGRQQFMAGQYTQAAEALRRANDFYHSRKLGLVLLGLRAAPRLLRGVYGLRHRVQTQRARAAAARAVTSGVRQ